MSNIREVLGRVTVHPFPARMAPGLAVDALSKLKASARILDPMAGSGTVLALGRRWGHRCLGFDLDPLAVLISRVWTTTVEVVDVRAAAAHVLERARANMVESSPCVSFPPGADAETREFVRYWFDSTARRQLRALSAAIDDVEETKVREALWCAFSRQIIAKQAGVSLALDLAHSRPHRKFLQAPRRPFDLFLRAVERVIEGCLHPGLRGRGPAASVALGDARAMEVADRSIDLVFTSPPYLNAIDYLRCSKFSLVWMGYSIRKLRDIRRVCIGAEVGAETGANFGEVINELRLGGVLAPRFEGILRRYIDDSARSMKEVARVLAPGGRAVFVLGENTVRGVFIPTSMIFSCLGAKLGLRVQERQFRELPANRRYLPPPGGSQTSLDGRIRREVMLTFEAA